MRSFWKGAISFGLVNIPVRLYTATESRDPQLHYLHAPCMAPVQYRKVCSACGVEVPKDELILGAETDRGYVPLTRQEVAELDVGERQTVAILQFLRPDELDPIYLQRHYYLEPTGGGGKAYALLRAAMEEEGAVGLCRLRLRAKPTLALLRPYEGRVLALDTLFDPDEVRRVDTLETPRLEASDKERELARSLIRTLTAPFVPEEHEDAYRQALERLIAAKAPVAAPAAPETAPVDLLEVLRASLAEVSGEGSRVPADAPH
jgi:DNA end-binding protein Ku